MEKMKPDVMSKIPTQAKITETIHSTTTSIDSNIQANKDSIEFEKASEKKSVSFNKTVTVVLVQSWKRENLINTVKEWEIVKARRSMSYECNIL